MIAFQKKTALTPSKEAEKKEPELVKRAEAERRKKADSDGTRRRARQTAENNRLI